MKGLLLPPDSIHYLRAAEGMVVPHPYRIRWLLPRVLGPHPERWQSLTIASLVALPPVAGWYFHARGLTGWAVAFAVAMLCSLPALRLFAILPVLTDAFSFTGTLLVATCATQAPWWVTVPLTLILGATRESAPVFAALWAWSPLPLVGLVAVGWWRPAAPPSPDEPWLAHPFREAWRHRVYLGPDRGSYVAPWGAALAGLAAPSWQMAANVLVAHAQLLVAVDTLRLAVWCAPVVVLGAAQAIPPAWWPVAIVVTLMHTDRRP